MENGNQTKRQVGMEKLKEMFSLISRFLVLPLFQDPPRIAPLCPRYLITGVATPFFVSLFCFGLSRRQKGPRSIRLLATGCWWRWWGNCLNFCHGPRRDKQKLRERSELHTKQQQGNNKATTSNKAKRPIAPFCCEAGRTPGSSALCAERCAPSPFWAE